MNQYFINFDKLTYGDKLWSIQGGEVTITNIYDSGNNYRIEAGSHTFTKDGKVNVSHEYPSLFKSNPFEQTSEYPKIMLVSDFEESSNWSEMEVLSHIPNRDRPYICKYNTYRHAKDLPSKTEVKLTLEDIARLANCDVEQLNIIK